MPASNGVAIVWGNEGLTFTGGVARTESTHFDTQSIRVTRGSDNVEVADRQGEIRADVYYNFKRNMSLTVVPSGTTSTLAATSLAIWMPRAGSAVTMTSTGAFLDTPPDGVATMVAPTVWNIASSVANQSNTGVTTVDLELKQGEVNNVAVTTG